MPELGIDDCLMFAGIGFVLMLDLAEVDDVGEQVMETSFGKGPATAFVAFAGLPALIGPAALIEFLNRGNESSESAVESEDLADARCFFWIDDQCKTLRIDVISQKRVATDPLALPAG